MNKKVNLSTEVLRTIYEENKGNLFSMVVIFISTLLVIFFVLPQVSGYFQKQELIKEEQEKLGNLSDSLSAIVQTDDAVLDQNLEIVSRALPANKDFAAILNAISVAAQGSGVSLGDFEFQIGDISSTPPSPAGTPSINISLNVSGDTFSITDFLRELSETTPVSEVSAVKSSGDFSTIEVVFYYKPFPPPGATDPEKIRAVSPSSQKIIDDIRLPLNFNIDLTPQVSANPL